MYYNVLYNIANYDIHAVVLWMFMSCAQPQRVPDGPSRSAVFGWRLQHFVCFRQLGWWMIAEVCSKDDNLFWVLKTANQPQ